MKTVLQKWGNSLALRIPKSFADEISVDEGHPVEVKVAQGRLLVIPVKPPAYQLADLVAAITRQNLHEEVTTGGAQGREIW